MQLHASITLSRVMDAHLRRGSSLDDPGFCTHCGEEADGVEPDARDYECEACGEPGVYGVEELLLMIAA